MGTHSQMQAVNMVPVLVCVLFCLSHLTEAKPASADVDDDLSLDIKQWDYGDGFVPYRTDDDDYYEGYDEDDEPEKSTGVMKRQYGDGFVPYRKGNDDYYDDYDTKTKEPKAKLFADDLQAKLKRHGEIASKTKKYFDFGDGFVPYKKYFHLGDGFVPYRRQYDDGFMPYRSASEKNT